MTVYWSVLLERAIQEYGVSSLLNVAMQCGARDYKRLMLPYTRTDAARNHLVETFLKESTDPDDMLVMLDCDHTHPIDVVERLVAHNVDVVGALYFRRSEPHDPLFYVTCEDGVTRNVVDWSNYGSTLIPCQLVATGAICIKRHCFDVLKEKGFDFPYFRYPYTENSSIYTTEDVYFGRICEAAGIDHHCDVSLQLGHLTVATVDHQSWQKWHEDHPDLIVGWHDD